MNILDWLFSRGSRNNKIKIITIGNSRTGKTAYKVCMYNKLNAQYRRYSLKCKDEYIHERLVSEFNGLKNNTDVDPTDISSKFSLELSKDLRVMDYGKIDWLDYSGGVLSNTDGKDYKKYLDNVKKASVLMYVIDLNEIINIMNNYQNIFDQAINDEQKIDVINSCISAAFSNANVNLPSHNIVLDKLDKLLKGKKFPPVIFLLTKSDLLDVYCPKLNISKEVILNTLVDYCRTNLSIFGVKDCPIRFFDTSIGGNIGDNYNPNDSYNLVESFLFAVLSSLVYKRDILRKQNESAINNDINQLINFFAELDNDKVIYENNSKKPMKDYLENIINNNN